MSQNNDTQPTRCEIWGRNNRKSLNKKALLLRVLIFASLPLSRLCLQCRLRLIGGGSKSSHSSIFSTIFVANPTTEMVFFYLLLFYNYFPNLIYAWFDEVR